MKKMTWMRGALALAVVVGASTALAADHLDGPAVKADATIDITDVFTWMDGNNVVLVLDVNPSAAAATKFSTTTQFVFHTASTDKYGPGAKAPVETDVICKFDATQKISCWVGTADYVTGDASAMTGLKSASGKVNVFAGVRDDPFFFNLEGFHDVEATVEAAAAGLTFGVDGCPAVNPATSAVLVKQLMSTAKGTMPAVDFFAPTAGGYSGNILSIVVAVDKSLLNTNGPIVSVWASTNKGS